MVDVGVGAGDGREERGREHDFATARRGDCVAFAYERRLPALARVALEEPENGDPAIDAGHGEVFGSPPARDTVRWFSDASALTRYGIETVNYGTSSGLPDPDGENLAIAGLRDIAQVYALVACEICGVST